MNILEAIELAKDYKAITGQAISDDIIEVLEYANELKAKVKRLLEIGKIMIGEQDTEATLKIWAEYEELKKEIMELVGIDKTP